MGTAAEAYAIKIVRANENMLVPWILMAAFLYYCRDCNLVSDRTYDDWCRLAKYRWRFLHHRHKHLITYNSEVRTVMVMLREREYPTICRDTAIRLTKDFGIYKNKRR